MWDSKKPSTWKGRKIYSVGEKFLFHRGAEQYEAEALGGGSEFFWFYVADLGWILRGEPELMGEKDGQKYYFSTRKTMPLTTVKDGFFGGADNEADLVDKAKMLAMDRLLADTPIAELGSLDWHDEVGDLSPQEFRRKRG